MTALAEKLVDVVLFNITIKADLKLDQLLDLSDVVSFVNGTLIGIEHLHYALHGSCIELQAVGLEHRKDRVMISNEARVDLDARSPLPIQFPHRNIGYYKIWIAFLDLGFVRNVHCKHRVVQIFTSRFPKQQQRQ